MNCVRKELLLYAVTDRSWLGEESLYHQVEEAVEGGVTFLQLREKEEESRASVEEVRKIQSLCKQKKVPFVINDDVEFALKLDACGAHVGQEDMSVKEARSLLGKDKILGVSVQTVSQAVLARNQGADYLGVGAVFPTDSKRDAAEVSKETLREICQAVDIPVVDIGGIHKRQCRRTGRKRYLWNCGH